VVIRLQSNADLVSRHDDCLPYLGDLSVTEFYSQFICENANFIAAVMLMHCFYVNALFLGLCPRKSISTPAIKLAKNQGEDLR
jgi:hypothetical protein